MAKTKTASSTDAASGAVAGFEQSLTDLEQLVVQMERGEQSLDESLKSFERGIGLYRQCQQALEQAELKIRLLLDPQAPEQAEAFDHTRIS
ncbi:exodeoxyribonuclease VII small subunit [Frateuria aurantia]